ncbi:MAG: chromate resistance protein [Deltaproteobacteria bacterium]|nr:MAG: chromate resistance protein [Deltaproteobacteria bacterium]
MAAHPTSGHQALQLPQLVLTTDTAALYRPPVPAAGKPSKDPGWLLLIHQIPPKPNYFRVKIWRRLQRLGAVGIKNSVYALPANEQAHEDLNWVLRDVVEGGGDASLVEARFVEGLSDEQVREMFRAARDADYLEITGEARELARKLPRKNDLPDDRRAELEAQLARLHKRVTEVASVDFFLARAREPLEGLLGELAERLAPTETKLDRAPAAEAKPRGRTWVTRTGIHVDRMASAWLIRRFIDPDARFRFVASREYRHRPGELRFDMFDGEYTHRGELCTFEVLLARFEIADGALRPIAEMVHDIDLKDDKYGRPETAGIELVVNGIAMAHREDETRLARATAVLDDLYEYFKRKRTET